MEKRALRAEERRWGWGVGCGRTKTDSQVSSGQELRERWRRACWKLRRKEAGRGTAGLAGRQETTQQAVDTGWATLAKVGKPFRFVVRLYVWKLSRKCDYFKYLIPDLCLNTHYFLAS